MAFDWFRRTFFNRSDKAADQAPEPIEETSSEADPAEPSESLETSAPKVTDEFTDEATEAGDQSNPEVSEAVMAFAQATYENIQRQTLQPEAEVSNSLEIEVASEEVLQVSVNLETELEAIEPVTQAQQDLSDEDLEALTRPDLPESIESEPIAEIESPSAESIEAEFDVLDEAEPGVEAQVEPEPEVEVATKPVVTEPVQTPEEEIEAEAESERDDEAEAETGAIAESVTESGSEAAKDSALPVFDEGFIWSAEVLARQGRKAEDISVEEISWLQKLRKGLTKTRLNVVNRLKAIVGQGPLNQDGITEIETLLLQADVGVEATDYIIEQLQNKLRSEVLPPDAAIAYLKQLLCDMLDRVHTEQFMPSKGKLNIWLMTGVNGAGKTTTIGKIAHVAQKSGYKCMIAAADTFRAAAVEQVKVWGQRSNVEVICNPGKNTDPAAVVFDGITAAQSRGVDLLLVDTAGRLQNKKNLMDELSKIRRIVDKKAPGATVESLLVLDATLGQNGLRQAQVFSESAQLTGVVLTKLDGTAKGGVALGVVQQLGLPIRFVGAGEGIEDLRPFSSYEFVEALLSN